MTERLFKTEDDIRNYWNDLARKALVGKTIKEARYMTQDEADKWGWYERSIVLFLMMDRGLYPNVMTRVTEVGLYPSVLNHRSYL